LVAFRNFGSQLVAKIFDKFIATLFGEFYEVDKGREQVDRAFSIGM
jgi:hypothetical protein